MRTRYSRTILTTVLLSASSAWAAPGQPLSDEWIEGRISGAIAYNSAIDSSSIDVKSQAGAVTLSGKVPTDVERDFAGQIARSVDGVTAVTNNLAVDPEMKSDAHPSWRQKLSDAATTAAVKTKLIANRHTHALSINVDTSGNIVTLSGVVGSNEEKSTAEKLAFDTNGVREVRNNLTVEGKPAQTAAHSKDTETAVSDAWISTKTRTMLNLSGDFPGSEVDVTTTNGKVQLQGYARSPEQKRAIEASVADVNGVKGVVNELVVRKPGVGGA